MQLTAIRQNNHFVVPELDRLDLDMDSISITVDDALFSKVKKSKTFKSLEKLNDTLGGDELVSSIMLGMPRDYVYKSSEYTDKEIWYKEAREQYE